MDTDEYWELKAQVAEQGDALARVLRENDALRAQVAELKKELAIAQAFAHWVVIERDKLRAQVAWLRAENALLADLGSSSSIIADLQAQVAEVKRENGLMRQYITRLANGSPTGDSPMSILKALDKGEL